MDLNRDRVWAGPSVVFTLVLALVALGVFGGARVARADPHGIFYTAIAQQQLFFNVLAALDQADYVETEKDREGIFDKRVGVSTQPPFGKERDNALLVKKTEIGAGASTSPSEPGAGTSALLSRTVTLEGADLYSDFLVRMFGAESARRNSMSELLRGLCEYGLGLKECEFDMYRKTPAEIAEIGMRRGTATVTDPLLWGARPFYDGVLGALFSGSTTDEMIRECMWIGWKSSSCQTFAAITPGISKEVVPRAYSSTIASWRREANFLPDGSPRGDATAHNELLDDIFVSTAMDFIQPEYEYPFRNIRLDGGEPYVIPPAPASASYPPGETGEERLTRAALDLLFAQSVVDEIAASAYDRIAAQQEIIETEGLLGGYAVLAHPPSGSNPQSLYGELSMLITNPVGVREAVVDSLPNLLGMVDTSQQASSLLGLDQPGSVQLVDRTGSGSGSPSGSGALLPGELGSVAGISTGEGGQVLGALNLFDQFLGTFDYDTYKKPTSPSANIIAPHLEQGVIHALRNLTAGTFRKAKGGGWYGLCGWTCR